MPGKKDKKESKIFFNANPQYRPIGTTGMYDNTGLSMVGGNPQI